MLVKDNGGDLHEADMVGHVCNRQTSIRCVAEQDVTAATVATALGMMLHCWVKDSNLQGRSISRCLSA